MPENDEILSQLFAVFRAEQAEHAAAIRAILAAAREDAAPAGDGGGPRALAPSEYDEVYRRVHSLKGAARAVDLGEVETVTHQMESVLGRVRAGTLSVPPATLHDLLEDLLEVCAALTLAANAGADSDAAAARTAAEGFLRETAPLLREEAPAPPSSAAPPPEPPAPPPPPPTERPRSAGAPVAASGEEFVRLRAQHLDDLLTVTRQLLLEAERQKPALAELRRLERDLFGATSEPSSGENQAASETTTQARRLLRRLHRRQQENVWRLGRIVHRLHDSVRGARTVTADAAAEGLDRMLAALARQQGKEVSLEIVGGDIAIDRQVAQALRDPLTHLLRNTLSHGIEPPSERAARGKPSHGSVSLRFSVQGARLVVEIEDDGKGIDTAVLRQAAGSSAGRAPEGDAEVSDEEVSRLIFAPGFSTARTPDRIAGRGLGLSIVSRAVSRLGGDVRFVSKRAGTGALFRMSLPLSLLTERLVLVASGGRAYGIPTYAVERLYRVPAARRETVGGDPMVRPEGGDPVPLASLASLLPAPRDSAAPPPPAGDEPLPVVLMRAGGTRIALRVDAFLNEIEGVIRPLGPYLAGVTLANGSVILEDGSIALALVPAEVAARAVAPASAGAAAGSAETRPSPAGAPPPSSRTILVVDDSITTRALMKSILEGQEYRVRIATDGAEALAVLRESANRRDSPIHLVVSDIEMPRMNGFDLLRAVKEDSRIAAIPVILVTSREAFEDRETGLSLGADAYLVKQRFDHRELLDTIEQLVL